MEQQDGADQMHPDPCIPTAASPASASPGPMASQTAPAEDYTVSDLFISYRKTNHSEAAGDAARWCRSNAPRSLHPLHASPRLPAAAAAGLRGSAPQLCCAGGADQIGADQPNLMMMMMD